MGTLEVNNYEFFESLSTTVFFLHFYVFERKFDVEDSAMLLCLFCTCYLTVWDLLPPLRCHFFDSFVSTALHLCMILSLYAVFWSAS